MYISSTFYIFLVLISLSLFFTIGESNKCSEFDSHMGATFDISSLTRTSDEYPYIITDGDLPCTEKVEQNYTYVFNICAPVASNIPNKCGNTPASVYQVDERNTVRDDDDFCFYAGYYDDKSVLSLLNPNDPTEGISLTYIGDRCNGPNAPHRTVKIEMPCADRLNPTPTTALETGPCAYTFTMPSVFGCPLECPVSDRRLCGGHGHCAYDETNGEAKCFCDAGYGGIDCSMKYSASIASGSSSSNSSLLIGLIVSLSILIVILGGSIYYMTSQMKGYKEDMSHYALLKAGVDGDSAVV